MAKQRQTRKKKTKQLTQSPNIKIIWLKVRDIQVPGAMPKPQWVFFMGRDNDGTGNYVRGYLAEVPNLISLEDVVTWTGYLVRALIMDTPVTLLQAQQGSEIEHWFTEYYEIDATHAVAEGRPRTYVLCKNVAPSTTPVPGK